MILWIWIHPFINDLFGLVFGFGPIQTYESSHLKGKLFNFLFGFSTFEWLYFKGITIFNITRFDYILHFNQSVRTKFDGQNQYLILPWSVFGSLSKIKKKIEPNKISLILCRNQHRTFWPKITKRTSPTGRKCTSFEFFWYFICVIFIFIGWWLKFSGNWNHNNAEGYNNFKISREIPTRTQMNLISNILIIFIRLNYIAD